jgi:hypothetical protein
VLQRRVPSPPLLRPRGSCVVTCTGVSQRSGATRSGSDSMRGWRCARCKRWDPPRRVRRPR